LSTIFDPEKAKTEELTGSTLGKNALQPYTISLTFFLFAVQAETIKNNYYTMLLSTQTIVRAYLDRSGYRHVDLSKLLSQISI
jgi:hypothetical protein